MPSDPTNDPSDESPDDDSERFRGLLDRVQAIVEALAEIEEDEGGHRRASGQTKRGSARIDYEYDVSIGFGAADQASPQDDQPTANRSRSSDDDEAFPLQDAEETIHVETRELDDEELLVTADLPGVTESDDVDVTFDAEDPSLKLTVDGEVLSRTPVDHPNATITDVSFNNQILEIRLTRSENTGGDQHE